MCAYARMHVRMHVCTYACTRRPRLDDHCVRHGGQGQPHGRFDVVGDTRGHHDGEAEGEGGLCRVREGPRQDELRFRHRGAPRARVRVDLDVYIGRSG